MAWDVRFVHFVHLGENRCKKHCKNEKNLQNTVEIMYHLDPCGCMLAAVSPSFSLPPSVHPRRTPRCDWLKWDHFLPMARAMGCLYFESRVVQPEPMVGQAPQPSPGMSTPQRTPLMNLTSADLKQSKYVQILKFRKWPNVSQVTQVRQK